jgi:uncharacterized protein YjbI with pentapeptide repeats
MKLLLVPALGLLMVSGVSDRLLAANPKHVDRLLKTNQCPLCDLSNADLSEANLFGANLVGANLKEANLNGANLGSANLSDADLTGAKLERAYLYEAIFDATNLSRANLSYAYLKDAKLTNVQFEATKLQGTNLSRANLVGTMLRGLNMRGANLTGASLTGVKLPDDVAQYGQLPGQIRTSLCERDTQPTAEEIANAKEAGFELSFADLRQSDLSGAKLRGALLVNGNLEGANLSDTDLSNACLNLANLTKANLDRANLNNTRLQASLLESASLKDLKNATNITQAFQSSADAERLPIEKQAKTIVSTLVRGQQAYYLENTKFAKTIKEIGLPLNNEDKSYRYQIVMGKPENTKVMLLATPKRKNLTAFMGLVNIGVIKDSQEATTLVVVCQSNQLTQQVPDFPTIAADAQPTCPAGYQDVKK